MNDRMDFNVIRRALKTLETEGRKGLDSGNSSAEAIGRAIAHTDPTSDFILRIAYETLEMWNQSTLCNLIEWINPLFHQKFTRHDLERMAERFSKNSVELHDGRVVDVIVQIVERTDA